MGKSSGRVSASNNPRPQAASNDNKSIKVKYISSPVMVEAKDASQFKEIVQHLTGQTPNFGSYSRPSTTTTTTTTTAAAATQANTYSYGHLHTSPQAGIDSYSWEELAEWNRNR
ncbi:hypothetical protein OSB04_026827 [Centaurea solstitialis]|uniref:VQ domain-containing protein n=1 Tax=Centaurea solstitialis TaxID=347529 RepID=A0AA38W9M9_9ASTR|nr:hypothetical protein OSB04_026827 [Centaurea solstitialis]